MQGWGCSGGGLDSGGARSMGGGGTKDGGVWGSGKTRGAIDVTGDNGRGGVVKAGCKDGGMKNFLREVKG